MLLERSCYIKVYWWEDVGRDPLPPWSQRLAKRVKMQAFSIKATWFALCLGGTVCSWAVLCAFAKSVNSWWSPMVYLVTMTLLEGAFCLGMIWHMDPFMMPRAFCLAQITIMNYSAFIMTGICSTFTFATTASVLWPSQMDTAAYSTLKWRPFYIIPLGIFPVVGTVVLMTLVTKFDAAKPSDGMHCDITGPLWVRFVGYAGAPLLLALPCVSLAVLAAFRITTMYKSHRRESRRSIPEYSAESIAVETRARSRRSISKFLTSGPTLVSKPQMPSAQSPTIVLTSPDSPSSRRVPIPAEVQDRQFHLPFHSPERLDPVPNSPHDHYSPPSPTSSFSHGPTFARFSGVSNKGSTSPLSVSHQPFYDESSGEIIFSDAVSSINRVKDTSSLNHHGDTEEEDGDDRYQDPRYIENTKRWRKEMSDMSPVPVSHEELDILPPGIISAIWRLILFQLAFFSGVSLLTLSTLVEVIRGHESKPMAFGSQHIALVFSAWGPVLVFAHSPGVRRALMFWR